MPHSAKPRILLLSAYDAGSHQRWWKQLVASQPEFQWQTLLLPPRFFRWRIRGNALSWLNEPALREHYDLLIVTSMVDLASVKAFHPHLAVTPSLLYMHENQFAYPDSGNQHASVDPQMVNLYSAITADRILFNSDWNRRSFLSGVRRFLDKMPDAKPDGVAERLLEKSAVVPVPIEDRLFGAREDRLSFKCPHLLWNHRWEYDKCPDRLLLLLDALRAAGQDFRVSVVGEQFRQQPDAFDSIRERYSDQIEHWGYLTDREDYDALLRSAEVVISTALHDFQGLSVLEAMASGCLALAPDRLAYPEYVPDKQRYRSVEEDPIAEADSAADTLLGMLRDTPAAVHPERWREGYLKSEYSRQIRQLLTGLNNNDQV